LIVYNVVGNNDDIPERKMVSSEDAEEFSRQIGITFFETGSSNKNVEELFDTIARQFLIRMKKAEEEKNTACCRIIW